MPRPSNLPGVSTVVIGNALIALYNHVTEVPAIYQKDENTGVQAPSGLNPLVFANYSAIGSTFLSASADNGNVNRPPFRFQVSNLPKPAAGANLVHWLTHWGGDSDDVLNLYRSLDGGITWELSYHDIHPLASDNVGIPTVGSDGTLWNIAVDENSVATVYKSTSQGEVDSWTPTGFSLSVDATLYDIFSQNGIVTDPNNANRAAIILNKFSSDLGSDIPAFFITEDGGDSWVEVEYSNRVSNNVAGFQNLVWLPNGRIVSVIEADNVDDPFANSQLVSIFSDDPLGGFQEAVIDPDGGWGNDPLNGALQAIDDSRLICTFNPGFGVGQSIYTSPDGGETWSELVDKPTDDSIANTYYDKKEDALYIIRAGQTPGGDIALARLSQPFGGNTNWEDVSDALAGAVGFSKEEINGWYGAAITAAS